MVDVTVRDASSADAAGVARVHVDTWRDTYRGIVPDAYLDALDCDARRQWWSENLTSSSSSFTLVGEDETGSIVAFASGGPRRDGDPRFAGELYAIYVLPDWQGAGVGRRLVAAVAERLRDRGMTSMLVWVLARNPACRFYEALGGRQVDTKQVERGGAVLQEVAYGWDDLSAL